MVSFMRRQNMKLITRDTDYAVRALSCIAQRKKTIVSVAELVKALRIPRPFLRKILQRLNREKIVKSCKGQGGGFLLALPADKISLLDLMEIFQGPLELNKCLFKKRLCPNQRTCFLRKKVRRIEKYMFGELKSINLASLSNGGN
jgi:Rrf2 family protein